MKRILGSSSLREQSVWATLAVTLVVYGFYAGSAWNGSAATDGGAALGLLIGSVVAQVILLIILSIALALLTPQEPRDERELRIEWRSAQVGYVALVSCVLLAVPAIFIWSAAGAAGGPSPQPVLIGHALFLSVIVSEVLQGATQIILYRRGA